MYLVPGGAPGLGGCNWSRGVSASGDVCSQGGVPGPGGCTWSGIVCSRSRGVCLLQVPGVSAPGPGGVRYSPPLKE